MSEIRLVRCPKCSKVLPEPPDIAIYKCGACGAILRSKKSVDIDKLSIVSERLVSSDKEIESEVEVGGAREGGFDQEVVSDMASRSPARSAVADGLGSRSPRRVQGEVTEFHGGLPKSPMRERFLNDLASVPQSPMRSRNVTRSPLRERGDAGGSGFDGVGDSPARLTNASKSPDRNVESRNVSRSPIRQTGSGDYDYDYDAVGMSPSGLRNVSKSPARSLRSRNVSRSPLRGRDLAGLEGVSKPPLRSVNEGIPKSPVRSGLASEVDDSNDEDEEVRSKKMIPKTSFNAWLPEDINLAQSGDKNPGRRGRTRGDKSGERVDAISEGIESAYLDESEGSVDAPFHGINHDKVTNQRDMRFRGDNVGVYAKSRVVDHGRISASSSSTDGPSGYYPSHNYGYGDQRQSFESARRPTVLQDLERERAVLLQKYKELQDQLSEFGDGNFASSDYYSRQDDDYSENEPMRFRRGSVRQSYPDRSAQRPPYASHGLGLDHRIEDTYSIHDDTYSDEMTRGVYAKSLQQFPKQSIPGPGPGRGQFSDYDQDSVRSYHNEKHYHHPSCSCSLCYVNDRQGQDLSSSLSSRRPTNRAANPRFSYTMHLNRHGPRAYDPRLAQTNPRERPSYLAPHHNRRASATSLNKRLCKPIAGGAPFVLCNSCFRLLILPQNIISKGKMLHQVQCGACSVVMSFNLQKESFAVPSSQQKEDPVAVDSGLNEVIKESRPKHHRRSHTATSTNVGSYDFDALGYGFQSIDSEASGVSNGKRFSSSSADNLRHLSPASSRSSKGEGDNNASARSTLPNSAEIPLQGNLLRPPPGSPLRDHFDYSTHFKKLGATEKSNYSGDDEQIFEKDFSRESSVGNAAITTETEVHSHEVSSQDSGEVGEDKALSTKDKPYSVTAFIKRGFASTSGRGSPGRAEVYVNGQPISHPVIKKAEKLAGPIHPGEYWYDSKGGFWGVMGHHCLGILPPFIQEFSYPIPEKCSGGDTAVYVNGRELHKIDLELLASRGLPTTKNKRYVVDISGKTLDAETDEEVANLGKLAPTVEKKKRGFGMQVPDNLHG